MVIVLTPVSLDREIGGRRIVRSLEPGEFTPRSEEDKVIAAWLVDKGLAEKPAKSEKEA